MYGLLTNIAGITDECKNHISFFDFPTWYKYLDVAKSKATGKCEIAFHLQKKASDGSYTGQFDGTAVILIGLAVIDILIRIAALVALFFVLYGGIKYITSQGSPDGTKAAQNTIQNALLGLIVAVTAAAFVTYLGKSIT
jgi:hypothetical protein